MIETKPTASGHVQDPSISQGLAIALKAMRATETYGDFQAVALAWPPVMDVAQRLAYYLSGELQVPGTEEPLINVSFRRFQKRLGGWQQDGLSTQVIRHALAAMLCTVRELAGIEVWRGEYQWNPCLGIGFIEFAQGQSVSVKVSEESPTSHPDDILRVIGHTVLTPAAMRTLSRDLRKLIREYEASCLP